MKKTARYQEPDLARFISRYSQNQGFSWDGLREYVILAIFCDSGHFGDISCIV